MKKRCIFLIVTWNYREFPLIQRLSGLQSRFRMLKKDITLPQLRIEPRIFCLADRILVTMQNMFYNLPCMYDLSMN